MCEIHICDNCGHDSLYESDYCIICNNDTFQISEITDSAIPQ